MNARIGSTLAVASLARRVRPEGRSAGRREGRGRGRRASSNSRWARRKEFEDAYARSDWKLARGYGESLQMDYPEFRRGQTHPTEARRRARANGRDEENTRRLAALWAYQTQPAKGGTQISAAIYSKEEVDTGGGKRPVRLIFRDHPEWGTQQRTSCSRKATSIAIGLQGEGDDRRAASRRRWRPSRPKTDEAIAMFIEDEGALWRMAQQAKTGLAIEFPVKAGGMRTAVFETGGADKGRLPKWR